MFSPQLKESVLFITLDSCRYDTFVAANAPNLKSVGTLYRTMAPGNFTFPSHSAMFEGFTPGDPHSTLPFVNPKVGKIFKMAGSGFPTAGHRKDYFTLVGRSIIDGFKRMGYFTVASGSMAWFNEHIDSGQILGTDFDRMYYPGNTYSVNKQVDWLAEQLNQVGTSQPVFTFLNVGEMHIPYFYEGADWSFSDDPCDIYHPETNDAEKCRTRQTICLEFVDKQLAPLLEAFKDSTIVVCADHGDAWGEDGLWSHGFHHEKVMEVPLLFHLADIPDEARVSKEPRQRGGQPLWREGSRPTVQAYEQELEQLRTQVAEAKAENSQYQTEYGKLESWAKNMEQRLQQPPRYQKLLSTIKSKLPNRNK